MSGFRLLLDYDVVVVIESLPRSVQRSIRSRLVEIRAAPSQFSDYVEYDAVGRPVQLHICGGIAIKYWIDHADRQVKVLDLHLADSGR